MAEDAGPTIEAEMTRAYCGRQIFVNGEIATRTAKHLSKLGISCEAVECFPCRRWHVIFSADTNSNPQAFQQISNSIKANGNGTK